MHDCAPHLILIRLSADARKPEARYSIPYTLAINFPITVQEKWYINSNKMDWPSAIEKDVQCLPSSKAPIGGNEATKKTQKALLKQQYETFRSQLVHEDLEEKTHDDDLEENGFKWNMAPIKHEGRNCSNAHKIGAEDAEHLGERQLRIESEVLATLEGQIVKYREHEVRFSKETALLKRSVASKEYQMGLLRDELEKVKQEKEGFEFKIAKFDKSAKDLSEMLESLEEIKEPEVNEYGPRDTSLKPTIDCDKESDNSKENTDDSLEQHQTTDTETSSVKSSLKNLEVRENNHAPFIKDWMSDDEDDDELNPKVEKKTVIPTATKKEFVKFVKSAHKHMAPRAVLMKTGLKSVNTARPVNIVRSVNTGRPFSTARSFNTVRPSYTAHPKSTIHYARPRTYFQNQAQSTVHRPFYKRTALTKRCFNQRFNTGRPFRSTVNTVRARGFNVVKPSACWVWRPIKPNGASLSNSQLNDKGFVDSGCSRHMTGNIAHLSDFKDFDGGYVTFGGGAYGGRITGKGTIKIDNLDFDDVYFVKELKFNLFSVSQMCDKKNYVLFTDSECLVLSPNFKLPDENQILLKIPRQDNMYSFDMKNIVPKDSLTCLVAKATSKESMLWHRRLCHIIFKNINKLVKENLVRDLPLKNLRMTKLVLSVLKAKAVSTACYVQNRVLIVKPHNKTPYELFRGFKPAIGFMKPFGCHVTILNTLDNLGKFNGKSDEDNIVEEEDEGWICFLDGNNSSGIKKYRGSNSSDCGNTKDGVEIVGGVIGSGD
ncbi:ribonuclease H-like domain-containing protein [Tanacetum coccineum]